MLLSIVPAPRSSIESGGAGFPLDARTRITGERGCRSRAVGSDRAPAPGSTARRSPRRTAPTIDLRIAAGGAPESYRIAADAASVVVTGADAAGLFYGVQTLGQLIAAATATASRSPPCRSRTHRASPTAA